MRLSFLLDVLLGRRVSNRSAEDAKLGILSGVPAVGLDGLSSAAYGPEAALAVLGAAGGAALGYIRPITWAILVLLFMLMSSYWQTIGAYPNNGGSYIVARENLGTRVGLLAAGALMIDYILNVSVGISAGVAALTSAAPMLQSHALLLCLAILLVISLMNLRGTRESGLLWSVPTYLFVAALALAIVWGGWSAIMSHGRLIPAAPIPKTNEAQVEGLSLWLLLRAFASGCTAMTGVEAVSNGVSSFRDPAVNNARRTLLVIVVVLAFLLFGISELAHAYGVAAMDQTRPGYQSVLSQILGAVFGRGVLYYVSIGAILCVLCLSANTSFVGFPRLCRTVAEDGFLPRAFAVPGRRLVYTVGVLFLATASGGLLIVFDGVTDRLIPLFAVGAFLSFTLSQAGMAVHWTRQQPRHRAKLAINGAGAIATGMALVVIIIAKFTSGAWLTLIAIPIALASLEAVGRYYKREAALLRAFSNQAVDFEDRRPPIALIPIARWDRVAAKAVHCAVRISDDVTALHVPRLEGPDCDDEREDLRQKWKAFVEEPARKAGLRPPRLHFVRSDYRSLAAATLRVIETVQKREPRRPIFVLLPELVEGNLWTRVFHVHRERRLRAQLLRYGGRNVIVVGVPWQLERADPKEGIKDEEPRAEAKDQAQKGAAADKGSSARQAKRSKRK